MTSESWYEKVGRIPRKGILVVTLIVMIIPLFVSLNLPIAVTEPTRIVFEDLASLEGTGSEVLLIAQTHSPHWGEFQHMYWAIIQHIFKMEDVKLIVCYLAPDSPALLGRIFSAISDPLNKQYGVDYVNMPFLPQASAVFASMADDFRGTYQTDQLGTPIDELPVWDGINTLDDFEIIITASVSGGGRSVSAIWYPRFPELTYYGLVLSGAFMGFAPYLGTVFKSGLWGARHGAEYQILMEGPSSGVGVQMDVLSVVTVFCVVCIILGNIPIIAKKFGGK